MLDCCVCRQKQNHDLACTKPEEDPSISKRLLPVALIVACDSSSANCVLVYVGAEGWFQSGEHADNRYNCNHDARTALLLQASRAYRRQCQPPPARTIREHPRAFSSPNRSKPSEHCKWTRATDSYTYSVFRTTSADW